jgi:hypothetical protein
MPEAGKSMGRKPKEEVQVSKVERVARAWQDLSRENRVLVIGGDMILSGAQIGVTSQVTEIMSNSAALYFKLSLIALHPQEELTFEFATSAVYRFIPDLSFRELAHMRQSFPKADILDVAASYMLLHRWIKKIKFYICDDGKVRCSLTLVGHDMDSVDCFHFGRDEEVEIFFSRRSIV